MVLKVIELMAGSEKSWVDATKNAIDKASKSVNNIKSAWVKDQSVIIKENQITEYRVNVKISFGVDQCLYALIKTLLNLFKKCFFCNLKI